jgi:hypothetical protein
MFRSLIGIGIPVSGDRDSFRRGGLLPRELRRHRVEGADLLVQPVDALQVVLGDLDGG